MRNLWNGEFSVGFGAVRGPSLPLQDDLTVIDRDQPAGRV